MRSLQGVDAGAKVDRAPRGRWADSNGRAGRGAGFFLGTPRAGRDPREGVRPMSAGSRRGRRLTASGSTDLNCSLSVPGDTRSGPAAVHWGRAREPEEGAPLRGCGVGAPCGQTSGEAAHLVGLT